MKRLLYLWVAVWLLGAPPGFAQERGPLISVDRPAPLGPGEAYASPQEEALHAAWAAYADRDKESAYKRLAPFLKDNPAGAGDPAFDALMGNLQFFAKDETGNPQEALIRLKHAADKGFMHAAYIY